jgi:hypothetical protein
MIFYNSFNGSKKAKTIEKEKKKPESNEPKRLEKIYVFLIVIASFLPLSALNNLNHVSCIKMYRPHY